MLIIFGLCLVQAFSVRTSRKAVAKLIPAVRTLVSIPAGMAKMEPLSYTLWSAAGVVIWNAVFVGAGYFLGEGALKLLG